MRAVQLGLVFLLMGLTPGWTDERSDILKQAGRDQPGCHFSAPRVCGKWALLQWAAHEAEGMLLLHKIESGWHGVEGGGGAMGAAELAMLGAPAETWDALLGARLSAQERARVQDIMSEPHWTWMTRKKPLTDEDLAGYSAWVLTLMRNEIFAVHGRAFRDPELSGYFHRHNYYKMRSGFKDSDLSALEKRNAAYISDYQRRKGKTLQ